MSLFSRRGPAPSQYDHLYTQEERAHLRAAWTGQVPGTVDERATWLHARGLGVSDVLLIHTGEPPTWSDHDIARFSLHLALLDAGHIEEAGRFVHGSDSLAAEARTARRLGLTGPVSAETVARIVSGTDAASSPAAPSAAPPRQVAADTLPSHMRQATLPDGTDFTDPETLRSWEGRIQAKLGPTWFPMFPRFPDFEDGVAPVIEVVNARPDAIEIRDESMKAADLSDVARKGLQNGWGDLVEFDPDNKRAVFAHLPSKVRDIRSRLAELLGLQKKNEHQIEIVCHAVRDAKTGEIRLDQVLVLRAPVNNTSAEKRMAMWNDLVMTLPGGSAGWEIQENPVTGRVRLRYGQPRTLPRTVPMIDLLPEALDTSDWSTIPLGVTAEGRVASIDLTAGPHALVVGPTGSGKSVLLRQHAVSALAHGHDLIVIDAIKDGLDFLAFRPWCVAFSQDGVSGARAVIEAVYAEGVRRKAVLRAFEAPSWGDLPADVRAREGIRPLTVLFDEFMSAVIASPVPKGLDRDDPLVEEATRLNADKATILAIVGKVARELRFTGILLVIAMQRPDASLLPGFGEIRSNLTSAVQLVKPGSLPAQETLRMVFPGDQTAAAAETIMELDDGFSKGLATVGAEGGDVAGFRVGFGKPSEIPDALEQMGIPRAKAWNIVATGTGTIAAGSIIPPAPVPSPEPTVTDLGTVTLSLDDLDSFEDEAPATPESPGAPGDEWDDPTPPIRPALPDDLWDD